MATHEKNKVDIFAMCCRLCAMETRYPEKLIGLNRNTIEKFIPWFQISDDDKLPKKICLTCNSRIDEWAKFTRTISVSDGKYKALLRQYEKNERENISKLQMKKNPSVAKVRTKVEYDENAPDDKSIEGSCARIPATTNVGLPNGFAMDCIGKNLKPMLSSSEDSTRRSANKTNVIDENTLPRSASKSVVVDTNQKRTSEWSVIDSHTIRRNAGDASFNNENTTEQGAIIAHVSERNTTRRSARKAFIGDVNTTRKITRNSSVNTKNTTEKGACDASFSSGNAIRRSARKASVFNENINEQDPPNASIPRRNTTRRSARNASFYDENAIDKGASIASVSKENAIRRSTRKASVCNDNARKKSMNEASVMGKNAFQKNASEVMADNKNTTEKVIPNADASNENSCRRSARRKSVFSENITGKSTSEVNIIDEIASRKKTSVASVNNENTTEKSSPNSNIPNGNIYRRSARRASVCCRGNTMQTSTSEASAIRKNISSTVSVNNESATDEVTPNANVCNGNTRRTSSRKASVPTQEITRNGNVVDENITRRSARISSFYSKSDTQYKASVADGNTTQKSACNTENTAETTSKAITSNRSLSLIDDHLTSQENELRKQLKIIGIVTKYDNLPTHIKLSRVKTDSMIGSVKVRGTGNTKSARNKTVSRGNSITRNKNGDNMASGSRRGASIARIKEYSGDDMATGSSGGASIAHIKEYSGDNMATGKCGGTAIASSKEYSDDNMATGECGEAAIASSKEYSDDNMATGECGGAVIASSKEYSDDDKIGFIKGRRSVDTKSARNTTNSRNVYVRNKTKISVDLVAANNQTESGGENSQFYKIDSGGVANISKETDNTGQRTILKRRKLSNLPVVFQKREQGGTFSNIISEDIAQDQPDNFGDPVSQNRKELNDSISLKTSETNETNNDGDTTTVCNENNNNIYEGAHSSGDFYIPNPEMLPNENKSPEEYLKNYFEYKVGEKSYYCCLKCGITVVEAKYTKQHFLGCPNK